MAAIAPPILASTVLDASKAQPTVKRMASGPEAASEKQNSLRLKTGRPALDQDVLKGGFCYGRGGVVGVACEETRVGIEVRIEVGAE